MGRKDLGPLLRHLNITCVIRRGKAIKGDQEGAAADVGVGWGNQTTGVTDIKRQEYEKGGTGQLCHKLLRGQERRKSDRGLGRVTDDLNNGGWGVEEDRFWSAKESGHVPQVL